MKFSSRIKSHLGFNRANLNQITESNRHKKLKNI